MRLATWLYLIAGLALLCAVPSCLIALQDTTYYAAGYNEAQFNAVKAGTSEAAVMRLLGKPLRTAAATEYIEWIYGPSSLRFSDDDGMYVSSASELNYTKIRANIAGEITSVSGGYLPIAVKTFAGRNLAELEARFGKALRVVRQTSRRYLVYSGRGGDGGYYVRDIGVDASDRVSNIIAHWCPD